MSQIMCFCFGLLLTIIVSGPNKKTIFLCNFTCLIMENVLLCAFHRKMANCEKPHSWTWRNYLPWISICLTVSRIGSTSSYGRLRSWLLLSFSHSKLEKRDSLVCSEHLYIPDLYLVRSSNVGVGMSAILKEIIWFYLLQATKIFYKTENDKALVKHPAIHPAYRNFIK